MMSLGDCPQKMQHMRCVAVVSAETYNGESRYGIYLHAYIRTQHYRYRYMQNRVHVFMHMHT